MYAKSTWILFAMWVFFTVIFGGYYACGDEIPSIVKRDTVPTFLDQGTQKDGAAQDDGFLDAVVSDGM